MMLVPRTRRHLKKSRKLPYSSQESPSPQSGGGHMKSKAEIEAIERKYQTDKDFESQGRGRRKPTAHTGSIRSKWSTTTKTMKKMTSNNRKP